MTVSAIWLTCEQAILILKNFVAEDYLRVSALMVLFSKLLDMENFYKVGAEFSSSS